MAANSIFQLRLNLFTATNCNLAALRLVVGLKCNRHASSSSTIQRMPTSPGPVPAKYPQVEQKFTAEGFPILDFKPKKKNVFQARPKARRFNRPLYGQHREERLPENPDWASMWTTAKTFSPSAVPLPLRQSYEKKTTAVPRGKYANTELLKIANFLHLTPGAIKRHCAALKKFCTKWPENLDSDEEVRYNFPVTYVTRDYVHASPTIRDPRARVVDLVVNVADLNLNERDKIKLIELARHRYNPETNILTIQTDACPFRDQNRDYADYLLTALYYESQDHQEWENDRFDEEALYKIDIDEYRKSVEQKLGFN